MNYTILDWILLHPDRRAVEVLTLRHPADRPRLEVHPPPLLGAVHLLRLRQRLPERRPHAVRHRPLDFAKRQHRVRVHTVYLVSVCLYCYILFLSLH